MSFFQHRRKPREGEVDGVSYHYVDVETIQQAIENDEFIEHATFSGNTYGTSKAAVRTVVEEGKICILDIVSFSKWDDRFTKLQSRNRINVHLILFDFDL